MDEETRMLRESLIISALFWLRKFAAQEEDWLR